MQNNFPPQQGMLQPPDPAKIIQQQMAMMQSNMAQQAMSAQQPQQPPQAPQEQGMQQPQEQSQTQQVPEGQPADGYTAVVNFEYS